MDPLLLAELKERAPGQDIPCVFANGAAFVLQPEAALDDAILHRTIAGLKPAYAWRHQCGDMVHG
jgi:hypothetical protein